MREPMVKGAVLGAADPSLSTFTAVLYAAQMRLSAGGSFRFSCPAPALAVLGRVYSALQSGDFPIDPMPEDYAKIRFLMDYPNSLAKNLMPFGKARRERDLPELELGFVPVSDQGGASGLSPEGWGQIVDMGLAVLLAPIRSPSVGPGPASPSDPRLASVVAGLRGRPKPVIVWWLPSAPAPLVNKDKTKTPAIPPPAEAAARATLGSQLLAARLPALQAAMKGLDPGAAPAHFFAWVATEVKGGATRVVRRQQFEVGGVEPEYPFDELAALIAHLGKLAS